MVEYVSSKNLDKQAILIEREDDNDVVVLAILHDVLNLKIDVVPKASHAVVISLEYESCFPGALYVKTVQHRRLLQTFVILLAFLPNAGLKVNQM
jgi:hypothetical protein